MVQSTQIQKNQTLSLLNLATQDRRHVLKKNENDYHTYHQPSLVFVKRNHQMHAPFQSLTFQVLHRRTH